MSNHNLNIDSYSLEEIMSMFDLNENNMDLDSLKRAKRKVLMIHPDKSKLPKEYFLFYKHAFDILVRMYNNIKKVSQTVEVQEYFPNEEVSSEFGNTIQKINKNTFNKSFNELFNTHMSKTINTSRNDWFKDEKSIYEETISSSAEMNTAMQKIKSKQNAISKYNGVQPTQVKTGNSYYEEDNEDEYIFSDPFSKLKYDDLRKVHKDQTVFSVRESDFDQVAKYNSVEDYERTRKSINLSPIERKRALDMIEEEQKLLEKKIREKQYSSELQTMKNIENNKKIMASFLTLK